MKSATKPSSSSTWISLHIPRQLRTPSSAARSPEKYSLTMWHVSTPENDRQRTTTSTQFTTTSPSKNHVLHPLFSKPRSENAHKTDKKYAFRSPGNIS